MFQQLSVLSPNDVTLLEAIGKQRGCLRAGGRVDLERAAKILLTELRAGTLGQLTLETPQMMEAELIEMSELRAKAEAKKAAKLAKKRPQR